MTTKLKELGITQNEYKSMLSINNYGVWISRRLNTALFNKELATYEPTTHKIILTEKGKEILQKAG